jgi:hypothetical protein
MDMRGLMTIKTIEEKAVGPGISGTVGMTSASGSFKRNE